MLYDMIVQSSEAGHTIVEWIELAAMAIELVAVVIIVFSVFYGMIEYLYRRLRGIGEVDPYRALKGRLGRSMLLGLEILVAADIVRTVALEATLESIAILGLLVLIRTFLSWALDVEIEGRWPWQARATPESSVETDES
jgi:uncharacterized membrane protein